MKLSNLIRNKNKNIKKRRGVKVKRPIIHKEKLEAFRPTVDNYIYLNKVYNKSEFINKALSFYINYINRPIEILKELKRIRPILYRQIGRRKF